MALFTDLAEQNPSAFASLFPASGAYGGGTTGQRAAGAAVSAALNTGRLELEQQLDAAARSPQLEFEREKFRQSDARRQQLLDLIGLTPQTVGSGGLLGGTFFQSILGNPVGQVAGDVAGGVAGAVPGLSQPGGPDSPGAPGGIGAGGAVTGAVPGTDAVTSQIMNLLGGFGASERQRIQQQQTDLLNTNLARLESRGLGGSNLATNVAEQAARFGSEQNLALSDRLIGQQVGALTGGAERGLAARGQNIDLISNLLNPILNIG